MDADKAELLFGALPAWVDPDDPDQRAALFEEELSQDGSGAGRVVLWEVLADQIAQEEPPEVWATAQRLLVSGLHRHEVLSQLALSLARTMNDALGERRLPRSGPVPGVTSPSAPAYRRPDRGDHPGRGAG